MKSAQWEISPQIRSWLPRLQAHRGYWVKGLKENTLAAIEKAYDMKYEMVEFDVRLTKDKMVILFHDNDVQNRPIANTTYQDILKLIPVNTLEEVCFWLAKLPNKNFKFNIELKTSAIVSGELEKKVARIVTHFKLENQVLISSFNPLALGRMRLYCKELFRALLLTLEEHPKNRWYFKRMTFNFFAKPHVLNLRHEDWSEDRFEKICDLVPVVLWTYNELEFGGNNEGRFQGLGKKIHGVISDDLTPETFQKN